MAIRERLIEYADGETTLEGHLAWDDASAGRRPLVLVSHAYGGRGEFECERARDLARLGYAGFALDLYGKGVLATDPAASGQLMQPFLVDRGLLQQRLALALTTAGQQAEVDAQRSAAIGFCFGGLCVLDMARAGLPLAGVVSLHGLFSPPSPAGAAPIHTKILALHGWDDPMVSPEAVLGLAEELSARQADWQIHAYGGTYHSFTNPHADDAERGVMYNARAASRAWQSVENFLAEVFADTPRA